MIVVCLSKHLNDGKSISISKKKHDTIVRERSASRVYWVEKQKKEGKRKKTKKYFEKELSKPYGQYKNVW